MDITFKNLEYELHDGEKFPSFKAVLCIDQKIVGKCWNDGYGAVTRYEADDEKGRQLIKAAEADCCDSVIFFKGHEGYGDFILSRTLSLEIDQEIMGVMFRQEIADPVLKAWHDEIRSVYIDINTTNVAVEVQIARDMQKGILIGKPKDYLVYEYGISLARILDNPNAGEILVPELMKLARQFRGNQILNTNIPENILKTAGLKEVQYVKPMQQELKQFLTKKPQRKGKSL